MNLDPLSCKFDANDNSTLAQINRLKGRVNGQLASITNEVDSLLGKVENALSPSGLMDFGAEYLNLDLGNSTAVAAFKKRWGNLVDGLDDILANIENFDICKLRKKAKEDANGNLVEVPSDNPATLASETPTEPDVAPAPAKDKSSSTYASLIAKSLGISVSIAEKEKALWDQKKQEYSDERRVADLHKQKKSLNARFEGFIKNNRKNYNLYLRWVREKREDKFADKGVKEIVTAVGEYEHSRYLIDSLFALVDHWIWIIEARLQVLPFPESLYQSPARFDDYFDTELKALILAKATPKPGRVIGDPNHNVFLRKSSYSLIKSQNSSAGEALWESRDHFLAYLIGTKPR